MKTESPSPLKLAKLEGEPQHAYVRDGPVSISISSDGEQNADLPSDFLEPLSPDEANDSVSSLLRPMKQAARQFWKAGDYEVDPGAQQVLGSGGIDHVRVHPRFLHSNATSHKWVLGAIAELLDNAMDEVAHGATFVKIDMIETQEEYGPMLVIEDNGGGMNPDCMRHCMSLGYSAKSKMANTIGQYGNGFKTSTMRLGADVIVFTCSPAQLGHKSTASIGLLSYTFLRDTGQQDIIVPMVDFEMQGCEIQKLMKGSTMDWTKNLETIKQWSPFHTEGELFDQLQSVGCQGTRIIVYNLWENDRGELELDFDADPHDIQVRGINRNPKCIAMAARLPNSRHFLTYKYSLRSYAAILYLCIPKNFKIIMRGSEVKHHYIANDMMFAEKQTYRPQGSAQTEDGQEPIHHELSQMKAVVTIGFVKDAKEHADVQGFNVYHKNRLIKPFWRIWNAASSQGRGIIGVLEANFVEPAHDKQGFEKTTTLVRLEMKLLKMQKTYWSKHCHKVGYINYHSKKYKKHAVSDACTQLSRKVLKRFSTSCETEKEPFPRTFPRGLRSRRTRIPTQKYQSKTGSVASREEEQIHQEGRRLRKRKLAILMDKTLYANLHGLHDGAESQISDFDLVRLKELEQEVVGTKLQLQDMYERIAEVTKQRDSAIKVLDEERKQSEQEVVGTKLQLRAMHEQIAEVIKQRDSAIKELDEERKQAEQNDSELRRLLRDKILRVKELETALGKLQASHQ